jgi:SAM-dependent methyltransferase
MHRPALLIEKIDTSGIGLEIQPGCRPLLPKSAGFQVETVDFADTATLRDQYREMPDFDPADLEEVDHVVADGSVQRAVGKLSHFDYIVAANVIQYRPDLLGFLKDCEALLKPSGTLFLEIPDKRRGFEVFHPPSSTGAVLQAHFERRTRPGLGAVFDDRAYNTIRLRNAGDNAGIAQTIQFALEMDCVRMLYADERDSQRYFPVPVWKFVPSSFRLIINDLHEIGEISLAEQEFIEGGETFFMTLARDAAQCSVDRMALMRRVWAEQADV